MHQPESTCQGTLELFEREYLLRRSTDGQLIEGLHPIRCALLADTLCDSDVQHDWAGTALCCLPSLVDSDVYWFLLHAFSRRPESAEALLTALDGYQPRTWSALAGVFRALMWWGLTRYLERCRPLMEQAQAQLHGAWRLVLFDPGGVGELNSARGIDWKTLDFIPELNRKLMMELQRRAGEIPRGDVFDKARVWLATREGVESPSSILDWDGATEVAFWAGMWGRSLELPVTRSLSWQAIEMGLRELPLEAAADLFFALSFGGDRSALTSFGESLLQRFQEETLTIAVEDDGQVARAHFVFAVNNIPRPTSEPGCDPHAETMRRVGLLRRILFDRTAYGSQGYGHMLRMLPWPHDTTTKTAISVDDFPPAWLIRINGTFYRLAELAIRAESWEEHARDVMACRVAVVEHCVFLGQALEEYFGHVRDCVIFDDERSRKVADLMAMLVNPVELPKSAVDEWGIGVESTRPGIGVSTAAARTSAADRHAPYMKALRQYYSSVSNFVSQSPEAILWSCGIGRGDPYKVQEVLGPDASPEVKGHLPTVNLANAIKNLGALQQEFRRRFARVVGVESLSELESREQEELRSLWAIWYQFALHPRRQLVRPRSEALARLRAPVDEFLRKLQKRFKRISRKGLHARALAHEVRWQEDTAVWLTYAVDSPLKVYEGFRVVLDEIKEALPSFAGRFDIKHYSFEIQCRRVNVVPLVRGRTLGWQFWSFRTLTLPDVDPTSGADSWRFAQVSMDDDTAERLGMLHWEPSAAEPAARLELQYARMWLLVEHARSLHALGPDALIGAWQDRRLLGDTPRPRTGKEERHATRSLDEHRQALRIHRSAPRARPARVHRSYRAGLRGRRHQLSRPGAILPREQGASRGTRALRRSPSRGRVPCDAARRRFLEGRSGGCES